MRTFFGRRNHSPSVDAVDGIFIAQRRLYHAVRTEVLAGTGLTVEMAEILFELFLSADARTASDAADEEGFIASQDLLKSLGYTAGLLSRRVAWLSAQHWVETKKVAGRPGYGIHGNSQKIRITAIGKKAVAPIWAKYQWFAENLTAGIPSSDLKVHATVSQAITPGEHAGKRRPRPSPSISPITSEPALEEVYLDTPPQTAATKHLFETQDEFID